MNAQRLLRRAAFLALAALVFPAITLGQEAPAPATVPAEGNGLKANDNVAIIGDSITEQRLYSLFIEDYLLMCQPAPQLQATQFGWGGETAAGFLGRMDNDLLPFQPTVATTCYGMNDGRYAPLTQQVADSYRKNQTAIVQKLKAAKVHLIVLGSPGAVDTDSFRHDPKMGEMYNKTLASLGDIDKEIAASEGVVFADVHSVMIDVMAKAKAKYGHDYDLAGGDGVHPHQNGHLVMAYAFLKALGCNGDIGTITLDLGANHADATAGHKVLGFADNTAQIESTRYPFCFYGDPASPNATTGVLEFLPFNQDLNRLTLVVKGLTSSKATVTWGKKSREFAAADLAKGINLAAEFLDNPFSEPFKKVQDQIARQQGEEVALIKVLLHNLPAYRKTLPDEGATFDRIVQKILEKDAQNRKASAAAVVPVKYSIKVAPAD
jgi:lysophospholipase L1-like esterase